MSIGTPTNILNNFIALNQTVYDTGTIQLVAGRTYLIAVHGRRTPAGSTISSIVHDPAGTPLSFALATDGSVNARVTGFATFFSHEVWIVTPGSTTATALIRITWANGQSACGWTLTEIPSGVGAAPVVQVKTATGTSVTPAVTMSAFVDGNSMTFFTALEASTTISMTTTEGRSRLAINLETSRGHHADDYQNPNGGDTSVNMTLGSSIGWGAIGIEIRAAATGNPVAILASGASFSMGAALLAVLNGLKAAGFALGAGSAQVPAVVRGMKASGIALGSASSKLGVTRFMKASGSAEGFGSVKIANLRPFQASGMALGSGTSKLGVFRGIKASGAALSGATSKMAVFRGIKASGVALGFGSSKITVVSAAKFILASGFAMGSGAAKMGVKRGLKASGVALGVGSARITIVSAFRPVAMLASGLGFSAGSARMRVVIAPHCFPVPYFCAGAADIPAETFEDTATAPTETPVEAEVILGGVDTGPFAPCFATTYTCVTAEVFLV